MLREQGGLTVLSAKSFEDILSRDENICFRQQTALGEVMRNLDVDPAQLIDFGNATGGFAAQVAYGAELMRAGRCSAMILPEWFAENTLVMGANEPCDLRLIRRSIRTITGGYVTASPYSRLKALKAIDPDAVMEDIGCMDVRHHHQSNALAQNPTQIHTNPPHPPPTPPHPAPCTYPRLCNALRHAARRGDTGRAAARIPLRGPPELEGQAEDAHQGGAWLGLHLRRQSRWQRCRWQR